MERGKRCLARYGFQLLLFALVLCFFLITSRSGAVLFDDSGSYMQSIGREGIMPFYPLFLLLNQRIFGEEWYLWAVVIEQVFLAAFSIVFFEETVRRRANLNFAEGVILSVLALYPYTIEMPMAVMTQAVLTEGVAYSFFYIFLACLLMAVWNKSYGRLTGAFFMTMLLTSIRSQFQILFAVCGMAFWYVIYMRAKREVKGNRTARFAAGAVVGVVVSLVGIYLAAGLASGTRRVGRGFTVSDESEQELLTAEREEETEEELIKKDFVTSQYLTLIFSRGLYEADYEDAALFQDEVLRGLYLALYETVDAEQERYVYASDGLWMWKDIVSGVGSIGMSCFFVPPKYYVEHAPEIIRSENYGAIRYSHMQTIGLTLIRAHFGRFLYHTLMLMPQAFVSTVFFQYAPLYGFCHMVTFFLYLSAVALMIWGYADPKASKEMAEMMALVLVTNVVTVVILSLVFFGQQRYLVYTFGSFYMAYYLLLRQLWLVRVRKVL